MFIRPIRIRKNGKSHAYWALVESYRTERGPRQRVVAHLGKLDKLGRLGIKQRAEGRGWGYQQNLFDEGGQAEWIEVDASRVEVKRSRDFGGPWLGLELAEMVGLSRFLRKRLPEGREEISWASMGLALVLSRLCNPCSELHIAESFYKATAMADLLGVPEEKVNEDRLYRCLDALLPYKEKLEEHLKEGLGSLFDLEYDLLLYDVTSAYFEGEGEGNALAQRGYSRDHRADCKQVCIGLVVSRCGLPLGYEVFAGNRSDVTTLEEIVGKMEGRYGKAGRIWVVDRGMISERTMGFLRSDGRRYIVGTPRWMLKRFERELLEEDWRRIREGVEVKLCPSAGGEEVFILCRSRDRREKEKAIHERFERRIEEGLNRMAAGCRARKYKADTIAKRVGRLLGRNSRAAGLFETRIIKDETGRTRLEWEKKEGWREWAELSEGCYLLRSNVTQWSEEDLWTAYIQLTEAEAAFRIQKSDLCIRPIWHQKTDRVLAHILVCFLAYVLWKTLGQMCRRAGLGDEPRRVFEELSRIKAVDVVLPTRNGVTITKRCITRPTDHQMILLQRLRLYLPSRIKLTGDVVKT